jgi:uncharacterized protein YuzE
MEITYDEKQDILFIHLSQSPIKTEVVHGQEVLISMTDTGVGQISIVGAKSDGLLPLHINLGKSPKVKEKKKDKEKGKEKKEKKKKHVVVKTVCCESYKKSTRCKDCPER